MLDVNRHEYSRNHYLKFDIQISFKNEPNTYFDIDYFIFNKRKWIAFESESGEKPYAQSGRGHA